MSGVGAGVTFSNCVSVPVQPFTAVTVTVYKPLVFTEIEDELSPVLHSYILNGVLVLKVAETPSQTLAGPVITGVGAGNWVMTILSVAVQPKASVAVTV